MISWALLMQAMDAGLGRLQDNDNALVWYGSHTRVVRGVDEAGRPKMFLIKVEEA